MKIFIAGALGAALITAASLVSPANALAGDALPPHVALRLDRQDAEFTMTEAKRRRLEYMQMQAERSQGHGRRGYGRGYDGRGYDRGPGYGYRGGYGPRGGYGRSSREWDRTW